MLSLVRILSLTLSSVSSEHFRRSALRLGGDCRVLALRPEFQFRLGVAYTDAFASVAICMLKQSIGSSTNYLRISCVFCLIRRKPAPPLEQHRVLRSSAGAISEKAVRQRYPLPGRRPVEASGFAVGGCSGKLENLPVY